MKSHIKTTVVLKFQTTAGMVLFEAICTNIFLTFCTKVICSGACSFSSVRVFYVCAQCTFSSDFLHFNKMLPSQSHFVINSFLTTRVPPPFCLYKILTLAIKEWLYKAVNQHLSKNFVRIFPLRKIIIFFEVNTH